MYIFKYKNSLCLLHVEFFCRYYFDIFCFQMLKIHESYTRNDIKVIWFIYSSLGFFKLKATIKIVRCCLLDFSKPIQPTTQVKVDRQVSKNTHLYLYFWLCYSYTPICKCKLLNNVQEAKFTQWVKFYY